MPTTYVNGAGALINGVPTKQGYRFAGWCTDTWLENCANIQKISTDAFGDYVFYAKWQAE